MKNKEIWIVTSELPLPTFGGAVRNFNIIKSYKRYGFNILLFSCVNKSNSSNDIKAAKAALGINIEIANYAQFGLIKQIWISIFKRVIPYMEEYKSSKISKLILNRLKKQQSRPKVIIFEHLNSYYAAQEAINEIRLKYSDIKIILDEQNVEYLLFKSSLAEFNFVKRLIGKYILANLQNIEKKVISQADIVFVCSLNDKTIFTKEISNKKLVILPNGVDTSHFKQSKKKSEKAILFMGKLDYTPNLIGLKYFFNKIYPLIVKENIVVYIVGKNPPIWLRNLQIGNPNIIITGFVKDVREYIDKASVCICPLLNGSGTRLKILEYMSMGKAIVSTSKGAEGIDGIDKTNILLADSPYEFAKDIKMLFSNSKQTKWLGLNSRKFVVKNYDWKNTTLSAVNILNDFVSRRKKELFRSN